MNGSDSQIIQEKDLRKSESDMFKRRQASIRGFNIAGLLVRTTNQGSCSILL